MFRCSAVLLVLALVLLTTQCSYATYDDYDDILNSDYGHRHDIVQGLGCVAEGRICQHGYKDCCFGMRCQCSFFFHNCRCQSEHMLINHY